MKKLEKIVVPTDFSEQSRRGVEYAAWLAAENEGQLLIMHVANEFAAWELYDDAFGYSETWPLDHVFAEAALELNRFVEPHTALLNKVPVLAKRLVLGPVPQQIISIAEKEKADLIVLSPRGQRGWTRLLSAGITEQVTRMSPCPVLSVTPPKPSKQWRGKLLPASFGWSRPSAETA
ncbi:MAG: universal stress protein [Candidatus Binatia bacterium]